MTHRLSPAVRAEVMRRLDTGQQRKSIAAELSISYSTVLTIARAAGFRRAPSLLDAPGMKVEVERLYRAGYSCYALADRYNVAPTTVGKWLDKLGVTRRTATHRTRFTDPHVVIATRLRRSGFTHAEIADVLSCSPDTVRRLLARRPNGVAA